ncbi:hypothetical protein HID58_064076 [Brassica napus]|uniref:Uncharacterized protein n=1 Tax=Brassica napus TaxID=3708 RepID=A0ABQ7Z9E2_BRANA|nr:hypothetical protein HID58_064076 [Brassica napus]
MPMQLTVLAGQTTSMGNLGMPITQIVMDPLGWLPREALSLRKIRGVMMIEGGLNLPLPRLPAKPLISPTRDASSKSNHSPGTTAAPVQRRSSLASRLSDPRDTNSLSEERIPAKERLSVHTQRTSQMERTEAQSNFK